MRAFVVEGGRREASVANLTEVLAGAGVNLLAFAMLPSQRRERIGFVADREDVAREALRRAGIAATEFPVIELDLANEAGTLARAARALELAGNPIELSLTLRASRGRTAEVIAVADPADAALVLRGLPDSGEVD